MAGHHPGPKGSNKKRRRLDPPGGGRLRRSQARTRPQAEGPVDVDQEESAWFSEPWRNGYHAVRLLEDLGVLAGGNRLPLAAQVVLSRASDAATFTDYDAVSQAGLEASLLPGPDGVVIPAACSCLANWIAKSHGGGHVPNVYLRGTVGWLLWRGLTVAAVRREVGRARVRDLGLVDGAAAEFERLWGLRRYAAAWSLDGHR